MSFFSALYTLLIGPLELFFEILFSFSERIFQNPGLSIVFLSLAMNFLVLPLYKRADAMQEEERETDQRLSPTVKHIKKAFSGDERFMILQTFYRENHYKPTDALKGSVSLLLEIPFFMAAYNFLSGLPVLVGTSFGPIQNLGVPDGLLVIGGVAINVLPVLMTAINLVSSAIYTRGSSFKSKLQLYVMAGLFLILLYDSPSGLVFYWTLNNLFSLMKNIIMKLLPHRSPAHREKPLVPLTKKDHLSFWGGCIFLSVLLGLAIPTSVIQSSPEEFINMSTRISPVQYILSVSLIAVGFFLIWFGIFYLLANNNVKKWMILGIHVLSVVALCNYLCFDGHYGNMSANLTFDAYPDFSAGRMLNLLVLLLAVLLTFLVWRRKPDFLRVTAFLCAMAFFGTSAVGLVKIHSATHEKQIQLDSYSQNAPTLTLSRTGQNVVVLMMDRAIGSYVPYLMNEKPELKEQFAGFTYYPNTISLGGFTNFGAPGLFGGYEYTPEEMNRRDHESLMEKNNEALKVMPVSFLQQGYEVTVCDPPYAGYDWIPDLSIYNDFPEIHAYNSMVYFDASYNSDGVKTDQQRSRNLFCFSLFKCAPIAARGFIYNEGAYNHNSGASGQTIHSLSSSSGNSHAFTRAFSVLENMNSITQIQDTGDCFVMLTNDTTHEPALLQEPEYLPSESVDNTAYDASHSQRFTVNGRELIVENEAQMTHYQANMAAFLKLGAWFDYLRSEDVFDNTKIIVVSDHGRNLSQYENIALPQAEGESDIMLFNPLLMVKDFNSTELKTDPTFMTNADTPALAMDGLIEDPVNPFTNRPINSSRKFSGPQYVLCSHIWQTAENNGNAFLPGPWYAVSPGEIWDLANWEYCGIH